MPALADDTALVIIDVQTDFCPGGALAVADGDAVVPILNRLSALFGTVVLTQDWHPAGHASFASGHPGAAPFSMTAMPYGPQVLWPDHCVQGTPGAAFHPDLDVTRAQMIVRKGFRPDIDSYSAFFENDRATATGLAGYLADRGIRHVVLGGLATDFCVRYSALDGRAVGLAVTLVEDACRAIDLDGSRDAAMAEMRGAGVAIATADALVG
ncbi:bifunctional nicotinamidase/pyrazinamidase [Roseospira visakhapatnamensis]|uniref:Nicotinamidase n=1 Tax=Roseospira visakhapatnamensis TaxID=390880 RepID=A0A7W6W9Y0_9PROT|nr:bifunctional nicotinamidase/pyrazinamidase [Roseospira visakhapatnamensis]MBB4266419.1 nicotinamidase/pyrazinamidase [Roseospira visakhapatnamensis]